MLAFVIVSPTHTPCIKTLLLFQRENGASSPREESGREVCTCVLDVAFEEVQQRLQVFTWAFLCQATRGGCPVLLSIHVQDL